MDKLIVHFIIFVMSMAPTLSPEMSGEQLSITTAINTAPKALIHLSMGAEFQRPPKLDKEFMTLQGADPVWDISRGYVGTMCKASFIELGTVETDGNKPPNFHLTDRGRLIVAPAAATLLTIADTFGVRQTVLTGESNSGSTNTNPIDMRYRAFNILAELDDKDTFVQDDLAELLICGKSTATSFVTEMRANGFVIEDPDKGHDRSMYAEHIVTDNDIPGDLDIDELDEMVRLQLIERIGKPFNAIDLAIALGYHPKYVGAEIADFLEKLAAQGYIETIFEAEHRSLGFRVTDRGMSAIAAMRRFYVEISNPSAEFLRNGNALINMIKSDPMMVKRVLERLPAKRGMKKPCGNTPNRDLPALDLLVANLAGMGAVGTKKAQTITGTSRTAVSRLLNKGHKLGKISKTRRGRGFVWEVISN